MLGHRSPRTLRAPQRPPSRPAHRTPPPPLLLLPPSTPPPPQVKGMADIELNVASDSMKLSDKKLK